MSETLTNDTIPGSLATTAILGISGAPSGFGRGNAFVNSDTDQDWIRINLTAGELYQFTASKTAGSTVDPTLALRDSAGSQILFDNDSGPGDAAQIRFRPTVSGTYYLDVGGVGASAGGYQLEAREVQATINTYSTIPTTGITTGVIGSANDQDWHRTLLQAGTGYIIEVNGAVDATVALRDSTGAVLLSDDNGGLGTNARLYLTPAAAATYFADVGGAGTSTGAYTVTIRIDDIADDIRTLASLLPGASTTGRINSASDQDVVAISLSAGQSYIFDATGLNTTLALRNSLALSVAFNDNLQPSVTSSRIEFTAATSGTYYLDVGGAGASTGNFVLSARVDDVADDIYTTDNMAMGGSFAGVLDSTTDRDWFRITLNVDVDYVIETTGSTDTTMALRDASGAFILSNDNLGAGSNARLAISPITSGTYYIDIGGSGGATGAYTFTARIDDYVDDIKTNMIVNVGGGVGSAVIETAVDQDFFFIDLFAGQSYIFDALSSTFNTTLSLRDTNGVQLAFNSDIAGPASGLSRIEYVATYTGRYFLDVGGVGTETGTYSVQTFADDVAADIYTVDSIALGGSFAGLIGSEPDQDWVRVDLTGGVSYIFETTGDINTTLSLRDAGGAIISTDDNSGVGVNARILATAGATGTFYLDVGGLGAVTGAYGVGARIDDVPDDIETNQSLAIGATASNFVINSAADQDFFRVQLTAGQIYVFDAFGIDTTLGLRDATGNQIAFNDDIVSGNLASRIQYFATTTGTYYLDVGGYAGTTGTYSVSAAIGEIAGDISTVASMTVGGAIFAGVIDTPGDRDFIRIALSGGTPYIIDVTVGDTNLSLRDANGVQIAFDDNGGLNNAARFDGVLAAGGTYYLDVGLSGGATGEYLIAARVDDVADDRRTTDVLAMETLTTGVIQQTGDVDTYRTQLTAGQSYIFESWAIDTVLVLSDANGNIITFNDNLRPGINDSRIEYTATASGTYYVEVLGFGGTTGSYNLLARPDDIANDIYTSASIVASGGSRTGVINSSIDSDFFAVSLVAGRSYVFSVIGGTLPDTELTLRNPTGGFLAYNDDNGSGSLNSQISFVAPTTGTYFLEVGGFGSNIGTYTLFA